MTATAITTARAARPVLLSTAPLDGAPSGHLTWPSVTVDTEPHRYAHHWSGVTSLLFAYARNKRQTSRGTLPAASHGWALPFLPTEARQRMGAAVGEDPPSTHCLIDGL
ncbi:hypothetical protein OH807_06250 [Kitasatospora sp. NBC_01560]|uniref:hypothetical protein n=1 Tax=Kitasatospora sp. NBC_01560 TaxID=2975965 RepID=UPI00386F361A